MFCKLYGKKDEQVLIMRTEREGGFPELKIYFEAFGGLATLDRDFETDDIEEAKAHCDWLFADIDKAEAMRIRAGFLRHYAEDAKDGFAKYAKQPDGPDGHWIN